MLSNYNSLPPYKNSIDEHDNCYMGFKNGLYGKSHYIGFGNGDTSSYDLIGGYSAKHADGTGNGKGTGYGCGCTESDRTGYSIGGINYTCNYICKYNNDDNERN